MVGYTLDKCFQKVVSTADAFGQMLLHIDQLSALGRLVATELNIPVEIFDDLQAEVYRIDFNDDRMLDEYEALRMLRTHLRRKRCGNADCNKLMVPRTALADTGYSVVRELGRGEFGQIYFCTKGQWGSNQYLLRCIDDSQRITEEAL